jgi:pyruvate/2-oxoglutarate dehydrogenase complex dihydrolipoamide dehydrogenase (E3) component
VLLGTAKIVDPWHVQIDSPDGSTQRLSTRSIVIATGAEPFVPPLPGLDEVGCLTSDTLWQLRELPRRLVVLGGGPIGCELAQAFARLGAEVTQVEMLPRIMQREDEEVSAFAKRALEATACACSPNTRRCAANSRGTTSSSCSNTRGANNASASTGCCARWAASHG